MKQRIEYAETHYTIEMLVASKPAPRPDGEGWTRYGRDTKKPGGYWVVHWRRRITVKP